MITRCRAPARWSRSNFLMITAGAAGPHPPPPPPPRGGRSEEKEGGAPLPPPPPAPPPPKKKSKRHTPPLPPPHPPPRHPPPPPPPPPGHRFEWCFPGFIQDGRQRRACCPSVAASNACPPRQQHLYRRHIIGNGRRWRCKAKATIATSSFLNVHGTSICSQTLAPRFPNKTLTVTAPWRSERHALTITNARIDDVFRRLADAGGTAGRRAA